MFTVYWLKCRHTTFIISWWSIYCNINFLIESLITASSFCSSQTSVQQHLLPCKNHLFIHCESKKKQDTKFLPITSPNINRFSNFFTDGLRSKFATNSCLNIPPCLKRVATLPCEIWMSEKWCQVEIGIVINDKSQGSIAKHLMSNELLYYAFHSICWWKNFLFKTGEHFAKLQAKWLTV